MAAKTTTELAPADTQFGAARNPADLDFWMPGFGDLTTPPWQMMRRMQNDLDVLLGRFFNGGVSTGVGQSMTAIWAPRLDISETDKEFLIEAELPGVKLEDIEVEVRDSVLHLTARTTEEKETREKHYLCQERRSGYFERAVSLPDAVDTEKIRCEFKEGILHCHLPKTEQARTRGHKIPIEKK